MKPKPLREKDPFAVPKSAGTAPTTDSVLSFYREALLALGRSPQNLRKVESDLNKLFSFLGGADVSTLTPKRLQDFQIWLAKTPMTTPRKRRAMLSAGARAHVAASVRSFLRWCYKAGVLAADFSSHIVVPKVADALPRDIPTLKELATLIRSQRSTGTKLGLRNAAVLSVLYAAGLRKGELVALNLQDVNFQEREVRVTQGKSGAGRTVPIAAWALAVLADYLEQARPKLLHTPTERLFLGSRDEPLSAGGVDWILKTACNDAGLRYINPHALRHAFCVHLLKNGAGIRIVSALAGHKSLNSTVRYTRLNVSDLQQVVRKSHPRGR